jgi:hypothetical protein
VQRAQPDDDAWYFGHRSEPLIRAARGGDATSDLFMHQGVGTEPRGAVTLRRGNSRKSSRPESERRLGHCGNCREVGGALGVRAVFPRPHAAISMSRSI